MADSFQLKAIITGVDKLSPVLDGISKNIKKAGKGAKEKALMAGAFGTAWSMAFVKPIKDAMAFESSMADVRKVVNFDSPVQFKQMSQDILDMSTQLPMAANDIAKIVAAGGQAGIAAGGLKEFATDAVKMGIAFDEGADVAGQQMAQWRVSLGLTQTQVEALGDQINYLGNTGPVASNQLTDVVTRVGSLGKLAHLSAGEVAALGDTISAAGIQTDVAATGIKRVITTLAGGHITKLQKAAFHALKLNPKKVAADMQKDGKKAILEVFSALSKVNPGKQIGITKALFGQESIEAIAPLLSNLHLLTENFDKVGDAARYAGSMQKEYESRASTTENQLDLVKNSLTKISTEMGDSLLPTINDSLKQAMPMLDSVADFIKGNPEVVKIAAAAAVGLAAIGGMAAISLLVASAGTIGLLLGALVAAAVYLAENWDFITKTIPEKTGKTMGEWNLQSTSDSGDINDVAINAYLEHHPELSLRQQAQNLQNTVHDIANPFPMALTDPQHTQGYDYSAPSTTDFLVGAKNTIQGEMVVRFENTPPGTRVSEGKTNAPNVRMTPEVGFSPYSLYRGGY
ncbi:phage tail tape measure protein [Hafnia alvei]|uniref:phage tail tape measure protein n=1 Tax=Hafnia alvei TaxID=569 RepID=UPI000B64FC77|nr:phage tail tape measure protein [Hafnia alvei]MBI0275659.1 phage tail tape measure protein [Hafnia alvei]PNK98355.1 phage tail tape measure protein [Hafnia alvei]